MRHVQYNLYKALAAEKEKEKKLELFAAGKYTPFATISKLTHVENLV